ncbi:MAG TPA: OmpA family protein [Acidimicrobiales bacterium]|nr:OmpA family protein [Acidimicrobiales bacterium]
MPLDSVDDVARSLNELRRMLAANDLSGVRRLVYFGQLDWLRERLEPREYFALRDRVNAGDMQWLRSRFLASDITWIKHAVQRGDAEALRIANRLGQLGWLEPIIPVNDYRQLRQRIDGGDLAWMQERLDQWSLEKLVDVDPATPPLIADTMAGGPPAAESDQSFILSPLAPPNRIEESMERPSDFYDDIFAGFDESMPRTPPAAIVSDMPPPTRYQRRRRRVSPAWIVALVMLLVAGALSYLSLRDSNERAVRTTTPSVTTTVARPVTVPTTVVATTAAPTTTAPPVTLAPLATDVVYFASGSTSISTAGAAVIDAAVAKIKANPGITVKLTGVADSSGSAATNAQVSQRRAQTVQDALKAKGAEAVFEITAAGTDATVAPDKARRVEIAYVRP